ncbi:hypothetical protein COY29_03140, partial [Candidatus Woesebacteria bacterium CG_4_10_14_0_2_um_filter_39_14]
CNNLIKSGEAIMATSAGDILKIKSTTIHSSPSTVHGLSPQEAKIYKVLQLEPLDIDEIAMKIEGNIVEIGSVLSIMSLKGLLTESGGKYYLSK